jgi:hypothetical protein
VLWRRSLDAVLVVPRAAAREPVTLAGTGPAVWELLATPASVAELADELAGRYATDAATIEADLEPLLDHLAALGVIEPTP